MRALVTGANGLLGANIIRELLRQGLDVTGVVRPDADLAGLAGLPVALVRGDVLDPPSLAAAASGQDLVFHTAVPFSYWGHEPAEMTRTAVEGSRNVLAAAAASGVRRVVMTSSSVTLGASCRPEARDETASAEDDAEEPAYVLAKISQETLAEMIGTTRSRVSFFMNKFRRLGLVEYNGHIKVNSSLLTVVLNDSVKSDRKSLSGGR